LAVPQDISAEIVEHNTSSASERFSASPVDFRYAPPLSQATICFPDDPKKSLVGQSGDLRYGFARALLWRCDRKWHRAPGAIFPEGHLLKCRAHGRGGNCESLPPRSDTYAKDDARETQILWATV